MAGVGSVTSLAFKLFAIDEASPVFAKVAASAAAAGREVDKTGGKHAAAGEKIRHFSGVAVVAATVVAAASLKMAGAFQAGLTTLVTGAGESEKNLKMVGDGIKKIAVETGTSTSQLIKGMFMIESAGFHGKAGLDVLTAAAKGARVGNADLGSVADATTTIMKDFAGQNINAAQAVNILVGTTKQGKTHMQDLAGAMGQVAPVAAAAHIKLQEMEGAMAELTSRGIPAAKAATGLKTMINNLIAPSGAASKAMASIGVKSKDLQKTVGEHGLAAGLKLLTDGLKKSGMSGAAATGLLSKMTGGGRSLAATLILSGVGAKGFADKTRNLTESLKNGKTKIDGWALAQKDMNFKMDKFKSTAQVAAITIGQKLIPVFSKILDFLQPIIKRFGGLIIVFVLVAGAIGALVLVFTFLTSTIGLIALAIVAVIVVIRFFITHLNTFKATWISVWNGVKSVGMPIWNALKTAFKAWFNTMVGEFKLGMAVMKAVWSIGWTVIKAVGQVAWALIKAAFHIWLAALTLEIKIAFAVIKAVWNIGWLVVKTVAMAVWNIIKILFQGFMNVLKGIMKIVMGVMTGNWHQAWQGIKQVGSAIWNTIKGVFGVFMNAIKTILKGILNTMSGTWKTVWNAMKSAGSTIWNAIKTTVLSVFHTVRDSLKKIWDEIKATAKSAWNDLKGIVSKPVSFVVNTVIAGFAKAWNAIVKKVGLGKLAIPVPHVGFKDGGYVNFARGGAVQGPGGPRDDKIPAYLSNGEYVVPADVVKKVGVHFFDKMRKNNGPMASEKMGFMGGSGSIHGGIPGFFGIPNPINVIKGAIGAVSGFVGNIAGTIKDWVLGLLDKTIVQKILMAPVNALLGHIPGAGVVSDLLKDLVPKGLKGLFDLLMKKNDEAFPKFAGGNIPQGVRKALIDAACKAAKVPPPNTLGQWESGMNTIITRESGWNSNAINRTDSNAAAGHPSEGLAQVILPTFNAYVPAALRSRGLLDPLANVAAAIRYIVARYGGITNVQQANPNLPPKGYARGGWTKPGWKIVGEEGPEMMWTPGGDHVWSNQHTRDIWKNKHHRHADGDHCGKVEVRVTTEDGREIERKIVKLKTSRGGRKMEWEK